MMDKTEITLPGPIPCNECPAGMMHARHITYFTWMGEELILVPHFPAWVCDMCGKREYDEKAIAWLKMLLSPNAGKPTPHRRRKAPHTRPPTSSPRPTLDS
jgi:YgiT-type zinc finger domain-containing protein